MWLRRLRFTLGYMIGQVAVKGALSGALWVMYWFIVDTNYPDIGTYVMALFTGVFGVVFGGVIGALTGVIIGLLYAVANAAFLRYDMNLRFYRYALMAIGGLLALLSWGPFWMSASSDDIWMPLSGGLLAAAGVAFSTYAYLPEYIDRVLYGRLYDPHDANFQPRLDDVDPFA